MKVTMKILIFEYITGGGMRRESVPPKLAREGELMANALIEDLLAAADDERVERRLLPALARTPETIGDVTLADDLELTVLRDDRFPLCASAARIDPVWVSATDDFDSLWRRALAACDAVWPIAPESGDILESLCRDAEAAGKILLNSSAEAVRLAGNKLETARRLERFGLPVVPASPLRCAAYAPGRAWVVKPNDGVGCEGARVVLDPDGFAASATHADWIVQPLIEGDALSLSALFAHGEAHLLSVNRQCVAREGDGFSLRACLVNALADENGAWTELVGAIARALPELWGYAGVDLILTEEGPRILEINPRLTTSYAGLRAALQENPAALALALSRTGALPPPPRARRGKTIEIRLEDHP
jgi:predicted ATP-grasp superfamily ATP-dependent carboligase